jgi:hypothetical protein
LTIHGDDARAGVVEPRDAQHTLNLMLEQVVRRRLRTRVQLEVLGDRRDVIAETLYQRTVSEAGWDYPAGQKMAPERM